jgi:hypothetical protein
MQLDWFWNKLGEAYRILTTRSYQIPIPFVTIYLCESKAKNKLKAEYDMRVALYKTSPRTEMLVASKQ